MWFFFTMQEIREKNNDLGVIFSQYTMTHCMNRLKINALWKNDIGRKK